MDFFLRNWLAFLRYRLTLSSRVSLTCFVFVSFFTKVVMAIEGWLGFGNWEKDGKQDTPGTYYKIMYDERDGELVYCIVVASSIGFLGYNDGNA